MQIICHFFRKILPLSDAHNVYYQNATCKPAEQMQGQKYKEKKKGARDLSFAP